MRSLLLSPAHARGRGSLRFLPYAGALLVFCLLPLVLPPFYQLIMTKAFALAIFAMSLDLLVGYTGLFSLGHGAFFGAGSYAVGMLMLHGGMNNFWISLAVGLLVATGLAAVFGLFVVRFSGLYFLLLTFALGELLFSVAWKFKWFQTPGAEACIGITKPGLGIPDFVWSAPRFYYFVLIFFSISFALLYRIAHSSFGNILTGIRENELRMHSLGYNVWFYKYIAYVIAGLFAGLGGVLFAYVMGFTIPDLFGLQYSFMGQLMIIIGGVATLSGPVIGALVMVFFELLISLIAPVRWPLIMGTTFVLIIMVFRGPFGPRLLRFCKRAD